MSRADAFTQSDITKRALETEVDPAFIERLAISARIPDSAREQFAYEIKHALRAYHARVLAAQQERPTRIVAALKIGLKPTNELLKWLRALPEWMRLDLQAVGIEGLLGELTLNIKRQTDYWKAHVAKNRPAGQVEIRRGLQQCLCAIHVTHCRDKNDRRRRRWIADVLRELGVTSADEKKDRKRFEGGRRVSHAGSASGHVAPPVPEESEEARARAKRLKGVRL